MKENLYVEFRKWEIFWGLLLDSEREINGIIKQYNEKGWNCIHVMTAMPNVSIFQRILIVAINLVTLGFVSYWGGAIFLFERDKGGQGVPSFLKGNSAILNSSTSIENILQNEISEWSDYQGKMSWDEANEKSKALGMRLPTIDELKTAYEAGSIESWKKDGDKYWSSNIYDKESYYRLDIYNGDIGGYEKVKIGHVRFCR